MMKINKYGYIDIISTKEYLKPLFGDKSDYYNNAYFIDRYYEKHETREGVNVYGWRRVQILYSYNIPVIVKYKDKERQFKYNIINADKIKGSTLKHVKTFLKNYLFFNTYEKVTKKQVFDNAKYINY